MKSAYLPSRDGIGLIEIGVHLRRRVQIREPDVGEKRLVALGGTLDVIGGLPDDQFVQERTHLQVQLAHRRGLLAPLAFPDFGRLDPLCPDKFPERRVRRIAGLIDAVLVAPPLVEALVGRQPALDLAKMPLTPQRCRVARVREQLGDRVLPGRQAALAFPGNGTLNVPERTDWRPVRIAERVGVHCDSTV